MYYTALLIVDEEDAVGKSPAQYFDHVMMDFHYRDMGGWFDHYSNEECVGISPKHSFSWNLSGYSDVTTYVFGTCWNSVYREKWFTGSLRHKLCSAMHRYRDNRVIAQTIQICVFSVGDMICKKLWRVRLHALVRALPDSTRLMIFRYHN